MTAPSFFKHVRKTTILLLVILLVFFIHRISSFFYDSEIPTETIDGLEKLKTESVVCHNVIGGHAFAIDSVFDKSSRIYFYSTLDYKDSTKKMLHKWYLALDTIFITPCKRTGNVCISSISPERLRPGEWSVDLVSDSKILASKQFIVQSLDF